MTAWLLLLLATQEGPGPVSYTVSMPDPDTHLFHVEMTVPGPGGTVDLVMPVWTPGSYKVRDYARLVQDFEAGGAPFRKIDKTTWRIEAGRAKSLTVRYRVFAHGMAVQQSWLDSEMGTIIGASVFFYVKGRQDRPCLLKIEPRPGWQAATGLEPAGPRSYRAADYDVLIDSPILLADLERAEFEVRGVKHHIALAGPCPPGIDKLRGDFRKIVEKTVDLFGEIPYKDYWFLVRSLPGGGGGGLEHLNSTLMDVSIERLVTDDGYARFQSLTAHEFIHTWLVKRIRPKELGPFDYTKENYTKLLWVMEGITSYYTPVVLRRAGLWSEKKALESFADTRTGLVKTPGRLKESPAMASYNAWIHYYQRGPHSPNTSASYYRTGKMLGLALDLEIRRRSGKSLDDAMRRLYREYAVRKGRGITADEFFKACQEVAGGGLETIFKKSVEGAADPEYSKGLEHVGLRFRNTGTRKPYLGVSLDGNKVRSVMDGSPAAGRLSVDDEILAINGLKVDMGRWENRVQYIEEGTPYHVTLFRRGYLKTVAVPFERRVDTTYVLERLKERTPGQMAALKAWLN